jgi:hypothetical protein
MLKDDNNESILKWGNHLMLATVEQMQTRNKVASLRATAKNAHCHMYIPFPARVVGIGI